MSKPPQNENELVRCPYDPMHFIARFKLNTHLAKCELNFPNSNKLRCKYNSNHVVPASEIQHHYETCLDRYQFERRSPTEEEKVVANRYPIHNIDVGTEESWDDDNFPSYNPEQYCLESEVIKRLDLASASVKKQYRLSERQRINDIEYMRQKSKKSTSTSKPVTEIQPSTSNGSATRPVMEIQPSTSNGSATRPVTEIQPLTSNGSTTRPVREVQSTSTNGKEMQHTSNARPVGENRWTNTNGAARESQPSTNTGKPGKENQPPISPNVSPATVNQPWTSASTPRNKNNFPSYDPGLYCLEGEVGRLDLASASVKKQDRLSERQRINDIEYMRHSEKSKKSTSTSKPVTEIQPSTSNGSTTRPVREVQSKSTNSREMQHTSISLTSNTRPVGENRWTNTNGAAKESQPSTNTGKPGKENQPPISSNGSAAKENQPPPSENTPKKTTQARPIKAEEASPQFILVKNRRKGRKNTSKPKKG